VDLSTIIGFILGMSIIVVVLVLDGGSPAELFAHPAAILLIFGGSIAAITISFPLKSVKNLPKLIMIAIKEKKVDEEGMLEIMVKMADKARREGLLALEEESKKIDEPFLKKGIMMVVDGTDPVQVRAILETNIEQMRARHKQGFGMFQAGGGFSPTFGIIGTVMGLISVLKQLDDPNKLAKSIASAFLATLWGLLAANMVFLPLGNKLKNKSEAEVEYKYMLMEGILSIQAGENPRVLREKLSSFLPPSHAKGEAVEGKSAPQSAPSKARA
jgi:chemotaxis protein MotA